MLHAISMPQPAPKSIYVREAFLVSLTPIKMESCGQPLPRYPVRGYQLECLGSDTRCRSRTESVGFRSKRGKTHKCQAGSMVASSTNRTGMSSRTGYTLRQAVHFNDSGFVLNSRSLLQAGQTTRSRRSWGIITGRLYDG